jgi:hypothetical protein
MLDAEIMCNDQRKGGGGESWKRDLRGRIGLCMGSLVFSWAEHSINERSFAGFESAGLLSLRA